LPVVWLPGFAAEGINQKWYGDGTEIPTGEGKLYLASVLDMGSRRVVGFALSEHHDAELAYGALAMAVAVRGGQVPGVIMHTDGGSEYTAGLFRAACARLQIRQSMGRPGIGPGQCGDRGVALHADLRAALAGNLHHQGGRPGPGSRLDRRLQPAPAALRVRHAQPGRLRTSPKPASRPRNHHPATRMGSKDNGGGCAAAGLAEPAKDTGPPLRPQGWFASRCARRTFGAPLTPEPPRPLEQKTRAGPACPPKTRAPQDQPPVQHHYEPSLHGSRGSTSARCGGSRWLGRKSAGVG
jgi:integrase-like protein